MRTIFAEYNPKRNSIDVYTSVGYMLRIDCWEAEKDLKTTPGSDCALNALAIDDPLEYARLYLDGNLQMWVDAEDLQAEMNRLGEFWSQHFVLEDRETPVDNVNGQEAVISWQENYYLSGLPSNVLNMNPWLEQSKGWLDYYESEGTLDARK